MLGDIGADIYICAPAPDVEAAYMRLLARASRGGSSSSSSATTGVAVLSLGGVTADEGYVRARVMNRTTLLVEHVRASDGRVLDTLGLVGQKVGKSRS